MRDVSEFFRQVDKDGNGCIDLIEFRELLAALGLDLEPAEAERRFDAIDVDENGLIEAEEFATWWTESGHAG